MVIVDSISIICVLLASFGLRFGYFYWPEGEMILIIFGSPLIAIPIFVSFKMYRSVVRYIGLDAMYAILQAITMYSVIWGLADEMFVMQEIPRSVIFINWMLSLIIVGGLRILARWVFTRSSSLNNNNVIIYGAGIVGIQLSNSLKLSNEFTHIAYVDDNKKYKGTIVNGAQVFNPSEIPSLINKHNVTKVLLAMPSISRNHRKRIINDLSPLPVQILSLPSMSQIADGKVKVDDLREINIKDLLGRNSVKPSYNLLKVKIIKKVVLVTGAGGSIGSELCRQIIVYKPSHLILFDISESSLYQIHQEIINLVQNEIKVLPVIGSITDKNRLINIFKYYKVQTIYHAAAYKHVPLVEFNQSQGVFNNSIGTKITAEAAIETNVETFVLISTDKAVRPTNTMGASKRVAELILQALSKEQSVTSFTMVRFGNVLDSSGSVIPLFKRQIKEGGPITITDVNMVRYFMTIPEAVELVIQAGAMAKGGDVFVLDMGEPVKINDLAINMIKLSGLKLKDNTHPDGDIEIIYTGIRPGEKLYEELLVGTDSSKTENKLIMRANESMIPWKVLNLKLKTLEKAAKKSENELVRKSLLSIVPEFNPNHPVQD